MHEPKEEEDEREITFGIKMYVRKKLPKYKKKEKGIPTL